MNKLIAVGSLIVMLSACGGGGSSSGSSSKSVNPEYSVDASKGASCPNGEIEVKNHGVISGSQTQIATCTWTCANFGGKTHQVVIAQFENSTFTGGWRFVQIGSLGDSKCKF